MMRRRHGRTRGGTSVEAMALLATLTVAGITGFTALGTSGGDAIAERNHGTRQRASAPVSRPMAVSRAAGLVSGADELAHLARRLSGPPDALVKDIVSETRFALGPRGPGYALLPTEALHTESAGEALLSAQRAHVSERTLASGWSRSPRSVDLSLADDLAEVPAGLHASTRYLNAHLAWTHRWMHAAFGNRLAPYRRWYPDDFDQLVNFNFRGEEVGPWHVDTLAVNVISNLLGEGTEVLARLPQSLYRSQWNPGFTTYTKSEVAPYLNEVISVPRGQTLVLPGSHADVALRYRDGGAPSARVHRTPDIGGERVVVIEPFVPRSLAPPRAP